MATDSSRELLGETMDEFLVVVQEKKALEKLRGHQRLKHWISKKGRFRVLVRDIRGVMREGDQPINMALMESIAESINARAVAYRKDMDKHWAVFVRQQQGGDGVAVDDVDVRADASTETAMVHSSEAATEPMEWMWSENHTQTGGAGEEEDSTRVSSDLNETLEMMQHTVDAARNVTAQKHHMTVAEFEGTAIEAIKELSAEKGWDVPLVDQMPPLQPSGEVSQVVLDKLKALQTEDGDWASELGVAEWIDKLTSIAQLLTSHPLDKEGEYLNSTVDKIVEFVTHAHVTQPSMVLKDHRVQLQASADKIRDISTAIRDETSPVKRHLKSKQRIDAVIEYLTLVKDKGSAIRECLKKTGSIDAFDEAQAQILTDSKGLIESGRESCEWWKKTLYQFDKRAQDMIDYQHGLKTSVEEARAYEKELVEANTAKRAAIKEQMADLCKQLIEVEQSEAFAKQQRLQAEAAVATADKPLKKILNTVEVWREEHERRCERWEKGVHAAVEIDSWVQMVLGSVHGRVDKAVNDLSAALPVDRARVEALVDRQKTQMDTAIAKKQQLASNNYQMMMDLRDEWTKYEGDAYYQERVQNAIAAKTEAYERLLNEISVLESDKGRIDCAYGEYLSCLSGAVGGGEDLSTSIEIVDVKDDAEQWAEQHFMAFKPLEVSLPPPPPSFSASSAVASSFGHSFNSYINLKVPGAVEGIDECSSEDLSVAESEIPLPAATHTHTQKHSRGNGIPIDWLGSAVMVPSPSSAMAAAAAAAGAGSADGAHKEGEGEVEGEEHEEIDTDMDTKDLEMGIKEAGGEEGFQMCEPTESMLVLREGLNYSNAPQSTRSESEVHVCAAAALHDDEDTVLVNQEAKEAIEETAVDEATDMPQEPLLTESFAA
ncbi:unnamed protein product [Vitrella brassicaformis CCMP3155]|uniref:Uncharacterized protein n=1 Tax=Vitrella brassicaformis (strain CCMP3155) TaxID=1169540 RepID=A0A0G4G6Z3_VITBC|nr:unnamed protein product [Vitrella brassicaformis CCMP3155]|mmetsp:Transcript_37118/g.93152  ORF Transcript_37118/g.93152 Transcript_37118/m.93152 type:complete len:887 (-) Transcript_37118:412-3072(-)|eukprot:CEM24150.1 unnamed protein product [Vitrella brassicaformis CCMP3155]